MRCPVQFFLGGCWALTGRSAQMHTKPAAAPVSDQVSMLDMQSDELRRALEAITVETLTPIEALNQLYQLKQLL